MSILGDARADVEARTMNALFALCSFAHDPPGILSAVQPLALVGGKFRTNHPFGLARPWLEGLELLVTRLADANHRKRRAFYDPKLSFRHEGSLAHQTGRL